eukprot:6173658-Pleurochrysis_carterae.AAC.2
MRDLKAKGGLNSPNHGASTGSQRACSSKGVECRRQGRQLGQGIHVHQTRWRQSSAHVARRLEAQSCRQNCKKERPSLQSQAHLTSGGLFDLVDGVCVRPRYVVIADPRPPEPARAFAPATGKNAPVAFKALRGYQNMACGERGGRGVRWQNEVRRCW